MSGGNVPLLGRLGRITRGRLVVIGIVSAVALGGGWLDALVTLGQLQHHEGEDAA
ncbi:hypothetical protein [Mycobacterium sp. E1715]|uniref:hypothetical protein n=1 Tax=Mycobacterium sp. E1715 TaxID=1856863 RepID=UPI0012EAE190|nr:hypothetical protein [Mycobacterium sp. E1715]